MSTRMPPMLDFVLLIGTDAKEVSSSEAHHRVRTSPLWDGRVERVQQRLLDLESYLGEGDLRSVSRLAWSEMFEMHSLFHTSSEPFTYWEPGSIQALRWLSSYVGRGDRPPIITMDAGANVHVLVPQSEKEHWLQALTEHFRDWRILVDSQGEGASLMTGDRK